MLVLFVGGKELTAFKWRREKPKKKKEYYRLFLVLCTSIKVNDSNNTKDRQENKLVLMFCAIDIKIFTITSIDSVSPQFQTWFVEVVRLIHVL